MNSSAQNSQRIPVQSGISLRRLHRRPTVFLLALLALTVMVGCGESDQPVTTGSVSLQSDDFSGIASDGTEASQRTHLGSATVRVRELDDEPPNGIEDDPLVMVTIKDWSEIQEFVRNSGKPTVLDVWSLSCEPCMREFPGLVRLQSLFGDSIACVSVNSDYDGRRKAPPETYISRVNLFLETRSARIQNYISATPNEELFGQLDIPSIPAVIVYDAEGNEVTRFVDAGETRGFSYEKNVLPFVQEKFALEPVDSDSGEEAAENNAADPKAGDSPEENA